MATISFADDVMPILKQFQGPMTWRFDLTSYEQVKANAQVILDRISSSDAPMPPPPFPPLSSSQIEVFSNWVNANCPP